MIAVILAGGSGTRFWPLSREEHPKQLLSLWDDKPMITLTCERLSEVIPSNKFLVACGSELLEPTQRALAVLDEEQFVVEPCARNTAAAIGLSAIYAMERFGDEVVGVFPSDHFVADVNRFHQCVLAAQDAAELGHIVTIGIPPTRPETGFGYIRYTSSPANQAFQKVEAFVEKPDGAKAMEYLRAGGYLWNAGMFFFKPSVILAEIARQLPKMHASLRDIQRSIGTDHERQTIAKIFPTIESISIDFGVMENADNVVVVPATFQWSDVGHWAAIDQVITSDAQNNVVRADAVLHNVRDSVVYSTVPQRLIAMAGLEGVVVVDTPDALLVLNRDCAQDVRELVQQLKDHGRTDLV